MIKKYGKKYGEISNIKENFFIENEKLIKEREYIADIYKKQPFRVTCKLCGGSLLTGKEKCFVSHKITYKICSFCHHVNGIYDDTPQFSEIVYCEQDYGQVYSEEKYEDFLKRKELIYRPKIHFLEEVISEKLSILEIGSGSGYFCMAAIEENYDILGIEISKKQVEFANKMIKKSLCQCVTTEQIVNIIKNTRREIVAAIGSLEHIYNLSEVLRTISENKNINFLYFSVPLFSLSAFFEMIFQDGFNRQLGGGHTHLFTFDSINYMNKKYNFEIEGQWNFGMDMVDLQRFIELRLQKYNEEVVDIFHNKFFGCLDMLQKVVDEADFADEVHMVVKVIH